MDVHPLDLWTFLENDAVLPVQSLMRFNMFTISEIKYSFEEYGLREIICL